MCTPSVPGWLYVVDFKNIPPTMRRFVRDWRNEEARVRAPARRADCSVAMAVVTAAGAERVAVGSVAAAHSASGLSLPDVRHEVRFSQAPFRHSQVVASVRLCVTDFANCWLAPSQRGLVIEALAALSRAVGSVKAATGFAPLARVFKILHEVLRGLMPEEERHVWTGQIGRGVRP
jgi:hypothetical protein